MTDLQHGVAFDLKGEGALVHVSWTDPAGDDAWLALDVDEDGVISSGAELFGNYTVQVDPPARIGKNGFNALAFYDDNGDGKIDASDAVFSRLLLWHDTNQDGVSQPNELQSLASVGITAISLTYHQSSRVDRYGNFFRYRSSLSQLPGSHVNPVLWDVFLAMGNETAVEHLARTSTGVRFLDGCVGGSFRDGCAWRIDCFQGATTGETMEMTEENILYCETASVLSPYGPAWSRFGSAGVSYYGTGVGAGYANFLAACNGGLYTSARNNCMNAQAGYGESCYNSNAFAAPGGVYHVGAAGVRAPDGATAASRAEDTSTYPIAWLPQ